MEIHNINQGKVQNLDADRDIARDEKVSNPAGESIKKRDEKNLSKAAELVSKARARAESVQDVREERVREVEEKLKAGAYDSVNVKEELSRRLAKNIKRLLGR